MQRQSVSSSNIKSIWYQEWILEIEFHSGWVYQYSWVPESIYLSLISASSIGSYFASNIKDNYICREV